MIQEAALLAILLSSPPALVQQVHDANNCKPIDQRFADNRRVMPERDRPGYAFVSTDFAQYGPKDFRGATLTPFYVYDDPATGEAAVLFLIDGVRDIEAFYVFDRRGKVVDRKIHSSMASCIY